MSCPRTRYSHLFFDADISLTGQANTSGPSGQDTPTLDMQQDRVLDAICITSNLGQAWINPHSSTGSKAPFPFH